ncbi:MAG: hypothetical protein KIT56_02750 [Gammaproteobacteria bacterium]|nr:hypothetical protein [Gammaproteobacteria bacterium]MCW5582796.1 hypothetical protein [Gammaproteobacteria bacterium]
MSDSRREQELLLKLKDIIIKNDESELKKALQEGDSYLATTALSELILYAAEQNKVNSLQCLLHQIFSLRSVYAPSIILKLVEKMLDMIPDQQEDQKLFLLTCFKNSKVQIEETAIVNEIIKNSLIKLFEPEVIKCIFTFFLDERREVFNKHNRNRIVEKLKSICNEEENKLLDDLTHKSEDEQYYGLIVMLAKRSMTKDQFKHFLFAKENLLFFRHDSAINDMKRRVILACYADTPLTTEQKKKYDNFMQYILDGLNKLLTEIKGRVNFLGFIYTNPEVRNGAVEGAIKKCDAIIKDNSLNPIVKCYEMMTAIQKAHNAIYTNLIDTKNKKSDIANQLYNILTTACDQYFNGYQGEYVRADSTKIIHRQSSGMTKIGQLDVNVTKENFLMANIIENVFGKDEIPEYPMKKI